MSKKYPYSVFARSLRRSNPTVMRGRYFVYIITNQNNTVLYTGVTNDLVRRLNEHKNKSVKSFSYRYNLEKLVYFEETTNVHSAIYREKQLKAGSRLKKIKLIENLNPKWLDLSKDWL